MSSGFGRLGARYGCAAPPIVILQGYERSRGVPDRA